MFTWLESIALQSIINYKVGRRELYLLLRIPGDTNHLNQMIKLSITNKGKLGFRDVMLFGHGHTVGE